MGIVGGQAEKVTIRQLEITSDSASLPDRGAPNQSACAASGAAAISAPESELGSDLIARTPRIGEDAQRAKQAERASRAIGVEIGVSVEDRPNAICDQILVCYNHMSGRSEGDGRAPAD